MHFRRHFVEKPWGRTDIPAAFGAPHGSRIGEIWYEIEGSTCLPVLVKWLFTSDKLSVQVHPSDADARAIGLPSGKEECWYIVNAEPNAVIGLGTVRPLNVEELREASLSGAIEALMDWRPVHAGEYFYIPAGTIHAIGAGITLVEVQQNADITYRLYDYGRLDNGFPRTLHLDQALNIAVTGRYDDPRSGKALANTHLVDGPHFSLWFASHGEESLTSLIEHQRWIIPLSGPLVGTCHMLQPGESSQISDARLVVFLNS